MSSSDVTRQRNWFDSQLGHGSDIASKRVDLWDAELTIALGDPAECVSRNWTMTQSIGDILLPADPVRRKRVLDGIVRADKV